MTSTTKGMPEQSITDSPNETQKVAAEFVLQLARAEHGTRGTATIIALEGDLGAGKTVFTKGVAAALGVKTAVTSPTFVIQKRYDLPEGAHWKRLIHIDAYRLGGEDELRTIGWDTIATDPNNLVIIEWPQQVEAGVPQRTHRVVFEEVDEETRRLTFEMAW